jgi:hypothetical protein
VEQPKSKDPQKELEIALAELEERVDRLRASYEQYFMGYEKIEPGVQRKDVDRRFTALRKQQIRNTALRFRFNVITQKFNTYSMYWTRICRQIEEGTFKRHVAKAAKRFGGQSQTKREQDWSIDVELGDFEDADMDAILAEAEAAAQAYGRSGVETDTIPPGTRTEPPPPGYDTSGLPVSETSFAMSGGRETFGSEPLAADATPFPQNGARVARPVALPPGAKPRVLLRRRDGEAPPPSTPNVSSMATVPPMRSAPDRLGPDRLGPPSSSVIRPAPATPQARPAASSAGKIPTGGATTPRAVPAIRNIATPPSPTPQQQPRAASPATTEQPAPGTNIPTPASPTAPQAPVSVNRIATRQPYRPAALPPTANRLPVAPAGAPRTPASPMAPPAAAQERPPSPAPRAPAASPNMTAPDSEQSRPSRRPPPPLPDQTKKT